jgi:hypothetical protein
MEPLLVPRLPDPVACLDETKAANREFTYLAGVLSIRDSLCMWMLARSPNKASVHHRPAAARYVFWYAHVCEDVVGCK